MLDELGCGKHAAMLLGLAPPRSYARMGQHCSPHDGAQLLEQREGAGGLVHSLPLQ